MQKPDELTDEDWLQLIQKVEKTIGLRLKHNYFHDYVLNATSLDFISCLKDHYVNDSSDWHESFQPVEENNSSEKSFIVDSPWGGKYQIIAKELRPPLPDYPSKINAYKEKLIKEEIENLSYIKNKFGNQSKDLADND